MTPQPAFPASHDSSHPHASSHPHETRAGDEASARRERIIEAAFAIGQRGGLAAISARGVARDAEVSVGYLYKLFPSKSDIMVAAAQRYFERSLSRELCRVEAGEPYVEYCRRVWEQVQSSFEEFHHEWLRDREDLPKQDLAAAHGAMTSVLTHAGAQLEGVIEQDNRIDWTSLPEGTMASSIAQFTMRAMMDSLKSGEGDATLLLALLKKGLYSPTETH